MGKAVEKFIKTSEQAIEGMRAGRYSTMDLTVLHDAVIELSTDIELLKVGIADIAQSIEANTEVIRENNQKIMEMRAFLVMK